VPPDEPGLLDAARCGDRRALETLLVSHYDRIHAVCRRMLGNEADALDAAQDTLLAAVRSLDRFDGRSSVGTWLYRIATNCCLDELRRRRRRPVVGLPGDDGDRWSPPRHRSLRSATGADPADEAAARLDVDEALQSLAADHRVVLVLRDVCDLPYDEIAGVLGIPVGTVRSRLARGRAALGERLTGAAAADEVGRGRRNRGAPRGVEPSERSRESRT